MYSLHGHVEFIGTGYSRDETRKARSLSFLHLYARSIIKQQPFNPLLDHLLSPFSFIYFHKRSLHHFLPTNHLFTTSHRCDCIGCSFVLPRGRHVLATFSPASSSYYMYRLSARRKFHANNSRTSNQLVTIKQ